MTAVLDTRAQREAEAPSSDETRPCNRVVRRHKGPRHCRAGSGLIASYGVPVAVAAAVSLSWYQAGSFIAAGDVSPMVRTGLASEYAWLWNHRTTGAGSTSFDIGRALEVAVGRLVGSLGGSPLLAQQIFYTGLAMLAAFGTAYFVRAWTRQRLPVAVAGVVGLINPFVMVNLPNPLPLLAIAVMGILGGLVVRSAFGQRVTAARMALASLPASYLAVNPPLVAVTAVWVVTIALTCRWTAGRGGTVRALRLLLGSSGLLVLANVWWLVPFVQVNLLGGAGIGFAAQTNVSSWAWSHAQNSMANVVTLNAQWGWRRPEYYPYAAILGRAPWSLVRWLLPLSAFAAPAVSRSTRKAAVVLVSLAAFLLFLGKGLHSPFGGLNAWMYVHVPGLWLLREPMSKVGPCLVLVYAVLVSMTVAGLSDRMRSQRCRLRGVTAALIAAGLVGMLAYPAPVFDGRVMADHRAPLPPTHVRLPAAWLDAADVLRHPQHTGKILELPRDPFYQVTTSWGYHGVDDLLQELVARPVLQTLPGGYFNDLPGVGALLATTQSDLLDGDTSTLGGRLRALGVSTVVVRDDLRPGVGEPPVADAARLEAALDRTTTVVKRTSVGVAHIYDVVGPTGTITASSQPVEVVGSTSLAVADGAASLRAGQVGIQTGASADTLSLDTAASAHADLWPSSPAYRLTEVPLGPITYRASVRSTPSGPVLEVRDPVSLLIDNAPVAGLGGGFSLPLPGGRVDAVGTPHDVRFLTGGLTGLPVATGDLVTAYRVEPSALDNAAMSTVGDCNATDHQPPAALGLGAAPISGGVRLAAAAHSACVSIPTSMTTAGWYRLAVTYRSIAGAPARLCVWLQGPGRCADLPPLAPSSEWANASLPVFVTPGTTGLRLYLYADGLDSGTASVSEYRALSLAHLMPLASATLVTNGATVVNLTSGHHDVAVVQPPAPSLDTGSGTVQDCANTGAGMRSDLRMSRLADGVELRARRDSACVWVPVAGAAPRRMVSLHLEARTLSGRPARFCLWEDGPDRCADLPALPAGRRWRAYDAIARTDPGTTTVRLYFYADGEGSVQTVTQYRAVRAQVVQRSRLIVEPVSPTAAADPVIRWRQENPGQYSVAVNRPAGPFVLALAESYAPGWVLRGLPAGATARHVHVDGYANGWLIASPRPLSVTVQYAPAVAARAAVGVSLAAISLITLWTLAAAARRRRGRGRTSGPRQVGSGSKR